MKLTLSLVALCAVLVLGVASLPMSTGGSAQADDSNFTTAARVASASVVRGGTAAITASVTSRTTATSASVDIEIYDANGAKVFERAYDNERFAAGQTIDHNVSWSVPANARLGSYSIQVGVFSSDWSTQHIWNDSAGSVNVIGSSPGAVTNTPTPVPSNTPTRVPATNNTSTPTRVPATNNTSTPTRTSTGTPTRIPSATPTSTPGGGNTGGGAMSGLHVVGSQIQNGAGTPVQLIGVNRSSAEYMCTSNSGTVFDGPADQGEVSAMKTWNIHAVRVVLNEDCWLGINGVSPSVSGANYQNAIAANVNLLTSKNIATILNLHFNAPGSTLATGQQVMADRDHSP